MNIWIPRCKILEPDREILAPIGLRGRFTMHAVNMESGKRRLLADFPNLITTNGANLIGTGNILALCAVGSGNTAPSLGDTSLVSLVGSTSTVNVSNRSAQASAPYYGTASVTFRFAAGVATGNLAEVGVGASTSSLFSRALILDGGGSPTTITVLAAEALDVTYQLLQYVPTTDVTGSVTIGGTPYSYTLRAVKATDYTMWARNGLDTAGFGPYYNTAFSGAIGAVTATTPAGSPANADSVVSNAYSSGSFAGSGTLTWNLGSANFGAGGVQSFTYTCGQYSGSNGAFQVGFGTGIPKDGTKVLTLSAGYSWAINTP